MDLISRQAAIDALDEYIEEYSYDLDENGYYNPKWCAMQEAKMTIQRLPSAERLGRWKDIEHAPNGLLYATCSVCGKRQTIETTNYCGNCGADMREKKNGCDDCFIPMFYNLEDDDSICRDCEAGE